MADEDSGEPRGVVSTLGPTPLSWMQAPHHQDFFGAQGYRTKPSFATLAGKGDNPTSTDHLLSYRVKRSVLDIQQAHFFEAFSWVLEVYG